MENKQVEKLVADYAAALNAARAELIPAYYTADAVFMPENTRKLTKSDVLKKGRTFLNKNRFHISYSIQDITVKDEYAFVQATAQTRTVNLNTNIEVAKTSQDFFVLRKDQNDWKIFRYMFNNVKAQ